MDHESASIVRALTAVVKSRVWVWVLLCGSLVSILAYDVCLALGMWADAVFFAVTSLLLAVFISEIVMLCITQDGYFSLFFLGQKHQRDKARTIAPSTRACCTGAVGSYEFWLDAVTVLSLATELWLVASHNSPGDPRSSTAQYDGITVAVVRAGRTTRIGTRLTRILPLLRPLRLLKSLGSALNAYNCTGLAYSYKRPDLQPGQGQMTPIEIAGVGATSRQSSSNNSSRSGSTSYISSPSAAPSLTATPLLVASPGPLRLSDAEPETRVGSALRHLMGLRTTIGIAVLVLCVSLLSYSLGDTSGGVWVRVAHAQLSFAAGSALSNCSSAGGTLSGPNSIISGSWESAVAPACSEPSSWAPLLLSLPGVMSSLNVLSRSKPALVSLRLNGTDVPLRVLRALGLSSRARASSLSELRLSERDTYVLTSWMFDNGTLARLGAPSAVPFETSATWSLRADVRDSALEDIGFTATILAVLLLGVALFNFEIDRIVLRPLAFIIDVVRRISENPLVRLVEAGDVEMRRQTSLQAQPHEQVISSPVVLSQEVGRQPRGGSPPPCALPPLYSAALRRFDAFSERSSTWGTS